MRFDFFKNTFIDIAGFFHDAFFYDLVIFKQFDGRPTHVVRDRAGCVVSNNFFDFRDGIFDVFTVFYLAFLRSGAVGFSQRDGLFQKRFHALIFVSDGKDHGNGQEFGKFFVIDFNAMASGDIRHVQGE